MNTLEMVREFHQKFIVDTGVPIEKVKSVRVPLLVEELNELVLAINEEDELGILDALTDLQYVLDGTYIAFGLDKVKDAAFKEVHRSNMSKLDKDGKAIVRADGKILKPEGWTKPELEQFI